MDTEQIECYLNEADTDDMRKFWMEALQKREREDGINNRFDEAMRIKEKQLNVNTEKLDKVIELLETIYDEMPEFKPPVGLGF